MALRMLDCIRGNFAGSLVSGVPVPAYFSKASAILRRLVRTLLEVLRLFDQTKCQRVFPLVNSPDCFCSAEAGLAEMWLLMLSSSERSSLAAGASSIRACKS